MSVRSPKFCRSVGFSLFFSGKLNICWAAGTCEQTSQEKDERGRNWKFFKVFRPTLNRTRTEWTKKLNVSLQRWLYILSLAHNTSRFVLEILTPETLNLDGQKKQTFQEIMHKLFYWDVYQLELRQTHISATWEAHLWSADMERHKSRGCISQHIEVRSRGRAHCHGTAFWIHLVVNQTPLLQKSMYSMKQQDKLKSE